MHECTVATVCDNRGESKPDGFKVFALPDPGDHRIKQVLRRSLLDKTAVPSVELLECYFCTGEVIPAGVVATSLSPTNRVFVRRPRCADDGSLDKWLLGLRFPRFSSTTMPPRMTLHLVRTTDFASVDLLVPEAVGVGIAFEKIVALPVANLRTPCGSLDILA